MMKLLNLNNKIKSNVYFILTIDYEIFGDGNGCVENCVIKPAEKIMKIAENFDVPVTFFVEPLEFITMEQYSETKEQVLKVKEQLKSAILRGHDAQLHLHPQWEGAYWKEGKGWFVNMNKWRIGDLDYKEILQLLQKGKNWLEELLKPVKSDYKCIAFRAGGWCIQPSQYVIKALKKVGVKIDSTVASGIKNFLPGEWCDFTSVPELPYWKVKDDVCKEADDNVIWEIPIATVNIGKINHLKILFKLFSQKEKFASGCEGSYRGPDNWLNRKIGKLLKFSQLGKVMLDISTMPEEILKIITTKWINKFITKSKGVLPIVAIGHTKNFASYSEKSLYNFLKWVKKSDIKPITYPFLLKLLEREYGSIR